MVLAMSRPWCDPKTGIWYLRKRIPHDLVALIGRDVHKQSLGTKDSSKAKVRHAEALAKLEACWANLRAGPKDITERNAHALVEPVYDEWLARHRDEPSLQLMWHPELFATLWTAGTLPEREAEPGIPGTIPITNVFYRSMRSMCLKKADQIISESGIRVDDWSRWTIAKAVGAAFQRASLVLAVEAQGYVVPSNRPSRQKIDQIEEKNQT